MHLSTTHTCICAGLRLEFHGKPIAHLSTASSKQWDTRPPELYFNQTKVLMWVGTDFRDFNDRNVHHGQSLFNTACTQFCVISKQFHSTRAIRHMVWQVLDVHDEEAWSHHAALKNATGHVCWCGQPLTMTLCCLPDKKAWIHCHTLPWLP